MNLSTLATKKRILFFVLAIGGLWQSNAQLDGRLTTRLPSDYIELKGNMTLFSNNILNTRIIGPTQNEDPLHHNGVEWILEDGNSIMDSSVNIDLARVISLINRTNTFVVQVVDPNGCEVTASIPMEFIYNEILNFFRPDGNGLNDVWIPLNQETFPEILTMIFDRYGKEVYRMNLNSPGWDGLYNQIELPISDYLYVLKLRGENDDREFVGHFTPISIKT